MTAARSAASVIGVLAATLFFAGLAAVARPAVAAGVAPVSGPASGPAAESAVTYSPPPVTAMSAAELKNYYAWREHMDWLLAPIHTRADLEKYLKETEKSGSPLDALAPDARRRLLSEIQFGPAGAFVVSYADLQYLSTEQVYKILALFGQQNWALRFTGGKIRAASPQPKSSSTQESIVQRRFDEYWKATQSFGESSQKQQAQLVGDKYDQLFSPLQNSARVRSLPSGDLRLLLRAAFLAAATTSDAKYAADARMDFAEMERRHFVGWPDYDAMFQSLVVTRQFAAALQFSLAHPDADSAPFPEYRDEAANVGKNTPTVLIVSATENELIRRPVDLDRPALLLILTDPHCHFCAQFEAALQDQPQLRAKLAKYSLWVTPPGSELEFATLQQWNQTHPQVPLHIMYSLDGWPMVKVLAMPQFFFLRHGKVVKHIPGYDNNLISEIESGLKTIGVNP